MRTTALAALVVTALGAVAMRAQASSADAASRDPQGRGLQLLAEREAIVTRQTHGAEQSARARGLALYRLVLAAKAERRSTNADRPGGRAIALGAAVLARDLREARLYQDELQRVRDERARAVAVADATAAPEAAVVRAPALRLLPPVTGRRLDGYGVARDEATRAWLFRTSATFASRASEPVRAAAEGRVVRVGADAAGGIAVVVEHASGLRTIVSGLASATVSEGTVVHRGGTLGTAPAAPSRVRLEVWRGRQALDPAPLLPAPAAHPGHAP
ncbi:MAG TPA: M23 family metallopeptidase [Polyangia bacterium]|nr:M23 family metallopeptidase [Polyangia bacterium]